MGDGRFFKLFKRRRQSVANFCFGCQSGFGLIQQIVVNFQNTLFDSFLVLEGIEQLLHGFNQLSFPGSGEVGLPNIQNLLLGELDPLEIFFKINRLRIQSALKPFDGLGQGLECQPVLPGGVLKVFGPNPVHQQQLPVRRILGIVILDLRLKLLLCSLEFLQLPIEICQLRAVTLHFAFSGLSHLLQRAPGVGNNINLLICLGCGHQSENQKQRQCKHCSPTCMHA